MPMEPEDSQPPPVVEVSFTLQIGKGQLQASAQVPGGTTTLTQLVPVLHGLSSAIVDATASQVHAEGYAISCKAGCAACCRQLVPLSLFEADALADWIRSLPPEHQAAVGARFDAAIAALENKGMLQKLDIASIPEPGSKEEPEFAREYLRAGVPCPFLENESCGIYPIRPAACREYLVTSPAQFCAAPTLATVRPVPMPVKFSQALAQIGRAVTGDVRGWIPLVFLFGWIRAGQRVSEAVQATGPELLRAVFQELETAPAASGDE